MERHLAQTHYSDVPGARLAVSKIHGTAWPFRRSSMPIAVAIIRSLGNKQIVSGRLRHALADQQRALQRVQIL